MNALLKMSSNFIKHMCIVVLVLDKTALILLFWVEIAGSSKTIITRD